MAITKTNFINYTRCPRFVALEKITATDLQKNITYSEYLESEELENVKELYTQMIEESTEQSIDKPNSINRQLQAMLPYYKQVEKEASAITLKQFGGSVISSVDTFSQKAFSFTKNNSQYICYVDIYNEVGKDINIIEVKAITSKKYKDLQGGYLKKEKFGIFKKVNNVYFLKETFENYNIEEEMPLETYQKLQAKLFNRFDVGSYFYDLAVQRYFIENDYLEKGQQLPNIHYYLAVLNDDYIFDGTYENDKAIYNPDKNGNELITFFNADYLTLKYQSIIKKDDDNLTKWLNELNYEECPLSDACCYKKQTECKFFKSVCGKKIPDSNSSLNYLNNGHGFTKENGQPIKGLELINEGFLHMEDIPKKWLKNPNHLIQRECLETHQEYLNKKKIQAALKTLEYPIYHLDFETFPCPLPRFKGEWPYIQSPFEFSLHIEKEPNCCDKEKDNVVFLATTLKDEREDLIKCLLKNVDVNKGTLFAQNVSFEKGRIKELANIFPKYKNDLMKLYNRGFDLLWLLSNNKELYQKLGFGDEAQVINYYHEQLSGSYSIKKTLPVFSELTYKNLDVKNGTEALVTYANYENMTPQERQNSQEALRIYCQQDTWAMVEILKSLRQKVAENVVNEL